MAKSMNYSVYFVNLADEDLNDGKLIKMFSDASKNSIIVIEEIDTVFNKRQKVDTSLKGNSITFGGLLNVLDGVVAKDGRIVVMTTNNLNMLDDALVRPGRIDVRLEFMTATEDQVSQMVDRFFGKENTEVLKHRIMSLNPSMAKLQEWCMLDLYTLNLELDQLVN